MKNKVVILNVWRGDVLQLPADVLALRCSAGLFGLDVLVRKLLTDVEGQSRYPRPGDYTLVHGAPGIAAGRVLLVGAAPDFSYRPIREFGRSALSALSNASAGIKHVAVTLQGPGQGLDEIEAFESLVAGFLDSLGNDNYPENLCKITIAELEPARAKFFTALLSDLVPTKQVKVGKRRKDVSDKEKSERLRLVGYSSDAKAHVFVTMPLKEEMEDVYHYGIQGPVREAGYLCERVDLSAFTGDVLARIRNRIKSATLVIADLTGANPNVYLEVGYAWGCGVPTILLVRDTSELKFDVRGQRCLVYSKIKDLEESLMSELERLKEKV
jgi:hypothetical protein